MGEDKKVELTNQDLRKISSYISDDVTSFLEERTWAQEQRIEKKYDKYFESFKSEVISTLNDYKEVNYNTIRKLEILEKKLDNHINAEDTATKIVSHVHRHGVKYYIGIILAIVLSLIIK